MARINLVGKWLINVSDESVKSEIKVDSKVLIDFYDDLRHILNYFFKYNLMILGGQRRICQVDKSLFRYMPK